MVTKCKPVLSPIGEIIRQPTWKGPAALAPTQWPKLPHGLGLAVFLERFHNGVRWDTIQAQGHWEAYLSFHHAISFSKTQEAVSDGQNLEINTFGGGMFGF